MNENTFVNLPELIELLEVNSVDRYFKQLSAADQIRTLIDFNAVKIYELELKESTGA